MTFNKLIALAAKAWYEPRLVKNAKQAEEDGDGDTFALALVRELQDTYKPGLPDIAQLEAAQKAIGKACDDLNAVYLALAHKIDDIERAKAGLSSLYGKTTEKKRSRK